MSEIMSPQLDYGKYTYNHPTYQHTQVPPQNGLQTVTIPASGGTEVIFELPVQCYNLAKSYLTFTATPQAGTNANYAFIDGMCFIRQIQLYTRTGLYIADIYDLGNYMNMTLRRETKLEDMLTWDKAQNQRLTPGAASVNPYGFFEGLSASNSTTTYAIPALSIRPDQGYPVAAGATTGASTINTNYLEPSYILQGTSATADPVITVQMPLGRILYSIFAYDKDIFFNQIMYVRIVFNPTNKIYFNNVVQYPNVIATNAPFTGTVAITNLLMYLAVEQNKNIEKMIIDKMNSSGIELLVPFIYQNKLSLVGSQQNCTTRYNRGHGSRLLKVFWAPYASAESGAECYDHSNLYVSPYQNNGAAWVQLLPGFSKLSSFYTMFNNVRRTQFDMSSPLLTYMVKSLRDKGSCIGSVNEWLYNFVWVEDFTGEDPKYAKPLEPSEQNHIDGLPLDTEQKFDIFTQIQTGSTVSNATVLYFIDNFANSPSTSGLNHYIYGICQRNLIIKPAEVQFY
jgi:hypothetical protein